MTLWNWLSERIARSPARRRGRQRGPERRRRAPPLAVEALEDRTVPSGYQQLNLVGYQPGMAPHTDPNLNGWGMDYAPGGPFCVADTTPGVATFYDRSGQVLPLVVTIPAAPSHPLGLVGRPAGVAYNPTSDFVISEDGRSAPALFLFDTRDGTICGWNPAVDPDHAIVVVDNSTEAPKRADYPGLVIAQNSRGQNVLYAADFNNNRIDMFDGGFHSLGSFTDPNVASQYPSFTSWQVEDIGGQLWVTFSAHKPGPFGGVVDVFDTDGNLLTPNHFAANAPDAGPLASPWGIVQAPADFGAFSNDILIGNVEGTGNINAFDPATGAYLGPLTHPDGTPIAIAGLWDLTFGGDSPANGLAKDLYFNAGPNAVSMSGNGLFGRISAAGRGDAPGSDAVPSALVGLAPDPSPAGATSFPSAAPPASGPSGTADGALGEMSSVRIGLTPLTGSPVGSTAVLAAAAQPGETLPDAVLVAALASPQMAPPPAAGASSPVSGPLAGMQDPAPPDSTSHGGAGLTFASPAGRALRTQLLDQVFGGEGISPLDHLADDLTLARPG